VLFRSDVRRFPETAHFECKGNFKSVSQLPPLTRSTLVCCESAGNRFEIGMLMRRVMCCIFTKRTSVYFSEVLSRYSP
jgi:hypothetical protein